MLLKQIKKLLCISVFFALLLPAMPLKADSTLDRLNGMLTSSARATQATSVLFALFFGYGTYVAAKETTSACKKLSWQNAFSWQNALMVGLGTPITAGCGFLTWICLKNSMPPRPAS